MAAVLLYQAGGAKPRQPDISLISWHCVGAVSKLAVEGLHREQSAAFARFEQCLTKRNEDPMAGTMLVESPMGVPSLLRRTERRLS